jgi:hypothetical protein
MRAGDVLHTNLANERITINGVSILSAALDGHTSEGKQVLRRLWGETQIKQVLGNVAEETALWYLKHALFRVEGQVVDKRLFYPTASKIFKQGKVFLDQSERALSFTADLGARIETPKVDFLQLQDIVSQRLPDILEMREHAMRSTRSYGPRLF